MIFWVFSDKKCVKKNPFRKTPEAPYVEVSTEWASESCKTPSQNQNFIGKSDVGEGGHFDGTKEEATWRRQSKRIQKFAPSSHFHSEAEDKRIQQPLDGLSWSSMYSAILKGAESKWLRKGIFEDFHGGGRRERKSNFHNSSRRVPDFDVNYSIRGLLYPSEECRMKERGGAERAKNGGEGRENSLNWRKCRGKNWGRQRDSDAPHSSIGEVKSYRLI